MSLRVDDEARKLLIEYAIKAFPENISEIPFIRQMREGNYEFLAMMYRGQVYAASQLRQLLEDMKEQDVKEPFDICFNAYYQPIILFHMVDLIFTYRGETVPSRRGFFFGSVGREQDRRYVLSAHLAFVSYDNYRKSEVGPYDVKNNDFYDLSKNKSIPESLKEL